VTGHVWLVSAGPGDPDLLTVRAARLLAEADLILYDALVDPRLLALAPRAQRFPVGKRGFRRSFSQRTIERLMIRAARAGRSVVRLKGGDAFVFGRGGEEVLALREAGVDVSVVPGLSSALAGPQAAGIPVTHREHARGVLVLTGRPDTTWRGVLATLAPESVTVVLLMGLAVRREVAEHMQAHGWRRDTPCAIVFGAHTPQQVSWQGTLATLTTDPIPAGAESLPGVIVIGRVVELSEALACACTPARSSADSEVSIREA